MPTSSAYAEVNGVKMYYEIHGAAPDSGTGAAHPGADNRRPLVLLHGGVTTIGMSFGAVLPALAADRHIVAPELQGHGHTADTDRALTVPNLASDVVALLDELGIRQADFLGYSLGGLTALEIGIRQPDRVGRLVLAATQYHQDGIHDEVHAGDFDSPRLPSQADFQEMAEAYAACAPHPEHYQDFLGKISVAANAPLPWTADDLRTVQAPTLLLIGDRDFVRVEHAAEMQRLIPGARLAVLPATNHMTLMRRTPLLLPLLNEFLD
ncbi:alpha/beta hydrolase [Streptomyces sp. WAC 01325]|uniref:alpha/beta fold hydrolase n=1 Tax=Streptomyces sp. WAC 01325 TaxID=2203202 RepID=UPI000F8888DF|nr:alpha/beta hydrolase [Streptomyces sp. WAC 01325]RSN03906.1 alpha/beta hydrolase [Streptomyces sp. WAC 01325]